MARVLVLETALEWIVSERADSDDFREGAFCSQFSYPPAPSQASVRTGVAQTTV